MILKEFEPHRHIGITLGK